MTETRPEVLLTMPARPEGVGVVRQALAGMADATLRALCYAVVGAGATVVTMLRRDA